MPKFRDYFPSLDRSYTLLKLQEVGQKFNEYGKEKRGDILAIPGDQDMTAEGFYEPSEGGCMIKWTNHKYCMRAYIYRDNLLAVTREKRVIPLLFRFISGTREFKKKNVFQKAIVVVLVLVWKDFLIETVWFGMRGAYLPEHKYNQPSRELYRLIKNEKIRDIICAILEYDCAYKYRAQDILSELNKESFAKSPSQEINRLFKIWKQRESENFIEDKFGKIMPLFLFFLKFNKRAMKEFKSIVSEMNIDAIKPTIEDKYWMTSEAYADSYNFMGLDKYARATLHRKL